MTPDGIFTVAQTALDCVCAAMDDLAETVEGYAGCPCLVYVSAGEPQIECCTEAFPCSDNGMLTAHLEDVYPSDNFPVPLGGFEPCKAATWVATLVITSARCARQMDDEGNIAEAQEMSDSAMLMAIDQYAILTALGCCLVAEAPARKAKRRVQIIGTTPQTSEGGCASVEVRALVELGPVCACSPPTS